MDKGTATDGDPEPEDFEAALKRLEQIVQTLERGDAPLEESIALYEQGQKLRAICEKKLADARVRIEKIRLGEDGQPVGTEPLDPA